MTLSALIKKGGLTGIMTATPATPATQEADKPVTVAPVATVAVAELPEPLPELSPDEKSNIRAWLAHIEEIDPAIIAEVVDRCQRDGEARAYFLEQAKQVPPPPEPDYRATCVACKHFRRISPPNPWHCAKRRAGSPCGVLGH